MLQTLILSVGLAILISGLCSVFEAVLYSISTSQIEMMKNKGHGSADLLRQLRSDIDEPITAILTLNTIAHTIGAAVAGAAAAALFGDTNLIWFSILFTLAILLFSEILPKTAGVAYAVQLAPLIAHPLHWLVVGLKPIIWLCRLVTNLVPTKKKQDSISAAELQTIASLSRKSGQIEDHQERVIQNILELTSRIVRQVMTPRTVVFSLDENLSVQGSMEQLSELSTHSRFPVFHETPNNVTGIVMRKDVLLAAARQKGHIPLSALKHPAHFVPETMPLNRVLVDFFDRRQHLFVVVDEYGAVTGVISMEDVLEEIVGQEIIDESDNTQDMRELARKQHTGTLREVE